MSFASLLFAAALAQSVTLPTEGGGVTVEAGRQSQTENGWYILEDYVVIEYEGGKIQADRVEFHREAGDLLAEGNVVLESGPTVVTGSRLDFNTIDNMGIIYDAVGWTEQDVTFRGEIVEKIGEDKYRLVDGELTSCNQALPIWTVAWSKAIINVGDTAQMWNPVVKFKKAPSAYLPYVVFPIKDERSTGFLMPQVSSSRRRGFSGTLGFFWAIARNQDAFFELDISEEEFAFSPEYRYVISDKARGEFSGQWAEINRGAGNRRREIEARYRHDQDFASGFKWRTNLNYTSSLDYSRENSTNPDGAVQRVVLSTTYLTKSWGNYSVTFRGEDRQWLDNDQLLRRLPEAELIQTSRQIGKSPVYWSFRSSISRFTTESTYRQPLAGTSFDADPSWERLRFRPEFRIPVSKLPWYDVVGRVNLEEVFYTAHLDPDSPAIKKDTLSIEAADFAIETTGPKLERFYGLNREPGKRKYHQLLEPRVSWRYAPDINDVEKVLVFDGIDRRSNPRNPRDSTRDIDLSVLDLGLTTRLLSKRIPLPGEDEPSSRELLSWSLTSSYLMNSFRQVVVNGRSERTRFSNIGSAVRWRPTDLMSVQLNNTYDIIADDITATGITGNFRWGRETSNRWPWSDKDRRSGCGYHSCLDVILNTSRSVALRTSSETVNLRGSFMSPGERIGLDFDVRRDVNRSETQTQEYVFKYRNQCLGTRVSYFWNRFGEREILFTLSLSNVGDFLDFRSSKGP